MSKLKITYLNTKDLIPYARNSRTHSDLQVNQIAASIKEFGFRSPVLVDGDKGILAGHGRVLAATKLGLAEVPTIDGSDMTKAQQKAYIIADNKLALNAGWDAAMLAVEIEELKGGGFDIDLLGFTSPELEELMSTTPQVAELGLLPDEKLENFLDGDTKILRLAYDEQEFETVVNALQELQTTLDIEDFSSIVLHLVLDKCKK